MGKIISEFDLCTGCNICMLACCEENHGGYNPRYAVLRLQSMRDGIFVEPVVCNQCVNAACIRVCPVQAISKRVIRKKRENFQVHKVEEVEVVAIDHDMCTGCGLCEQHCPRGVIVIKDKKAHKCELCQGEPACVKSCPKGALKFYHEGCEGVEADA